MKTAELRHDRALRKLLRDHPLERITISVNLHAVVIHALPASFHPLVASRRNAEIEKRGGSVSMGELSEITERSMRFVGAGVGSDLETAIHNLKVSLEPKR